jgi:ADP-ribosylglycohydrolase
MLGAVFGDIVGSTYEWHNVKRKDFPLRTPFTRYTDDSVMTLAVAQWLVEDSGHSKEKLVKCMQRLGREHLNAGYGGRFFQWLTSANPQPDNSWGNGSAMRVSPVALYASTLEEALSLAKTTAEVTHDHPEGIKGALAVAESVFICKTATSIDVAKDEIRRTIPQKYEYDLNRTLDEIRPRYQFDVSCQGSVPEAIIAFLESTSLEDCVRNAISIGGDSDTIAAIACSIYATKNSQEDDELMKQFDAYLSPDLRDIMIQFEQKTKDGQEV